MALAVHTLGVEHNAGLDRARRTIEQAWLADLRVALDVNPLPNYLVSAEGAVVFANRAARLLGLGSEQLAVVSGGKVVTLNLPGGPLRLVTLDPNGVTSAAERGRQLPPFLEPIARGLQAGLSDKEIAAQQGLALATTRTYVHRVMTRLGVSSRREIMLGSRQSA